MSSDYLNYELSKELHDLGVVFGNPLAYYRGTELHHGNRCDYYYFMPCETDIPAPSTAMLIDEMRNKVKDKTIMYFALDFRSQKIKEYRIRGTKSLSANEDVTTALGKALIALVKEDTKCQK